MGKAIPRNARTETVDHPRPDIALHDRAWRLALLALGPTADAQTTSSPRSQARPPLPSQGCQARPRTPTAKDAKPGQIAKTSKVQGRARMPRRKDAKPARMPSVQGRQGRGRKGGKTAPIQSSRSPSRCRIAAPPRRPTSPRVKTAVGARAPGQGLAGDRRAARRSAIRSRASWSNGRSCAATTTAPSFARYAAFIAANPSWPSIGLLRRRAEAMLWNERADPRRCARSSPRTSR